MAYNTDKPITKIEDDKLDRENFVTELATAIYQHNKNGDHDGIVIGLFGEWGSGKTSIINLVENKIYEIAKLKETNQAKTEELLKFNSTQSTYLDENNLIQLLWPQVNQYAQNSNKPLIIKFTPWNYSNKDDLIRLFFQDLISILGNYQYFIDISKLLIIYAKLLHILPDGIISRFVAIIVTFFAKAFSQEYDNNISNLNKTKKKT